MNPEAFSDLAASRHSVRDFRADPVPPKVIEEILEDARQAPSWSNTRPFMVALAFAIAASANFPVLLLSVPWWFARRATAHGAAVRRREGRAPCPLAGA